MTIDLTQVYPYIIGIMPALVAFAAGVIRQDRLPNLANEIISDALAVGVAVVQAVAGGKLGGSPTSDFALVASYTLAVMHTPAFMQFQKNIQSNVVSLGKGASPAPVQPPLDMAALAMGLAQQINLPQLALLLRNELMKPVPAQQVPAVVPQRPQVPEMQTIPNMQSVAQPVRTSTPPVQQQPISMTSPNWQPQTPQGWPPQQQGG